MPGPVVPGPVIPGLAVEEVPSGEAAAIATMVQALQAQIKQRYPGTLARRDAHPKHHGLVTASFSVDPRCPVELRHGLFRASKPISTVIRFSNGQPVVAHDLRADLRGMAIKLQGAGRTLLNDDDHDHDFLLATGEAFFGKDAVDFAGFPRASDGFWSFIKIPWHFIGGFRVRAGWQLMTARKRPRSPLAVEYFSQTPYRLGPHCVKYSVRPSGPRRSSNDPWFLRSGFRSLVGWSAMIAGFVGGPQAVRWVVGFNALTDSLARDLADRPVTLEFLVQRWPDLSQLPAWAIEDATRRWMAPWVRVATIEVQQQDDIPTRDAQAERMTFTPWRTLPEHQPLGSINRARLAIYREMSEFRRELNQPTP